MADVGIEGDALLGHVVHHLFGVELLCGNGNLTRREILAKLFPNCVLRFTQKIDQLHQITPSF
ncbi:hypothetical protein FQZ97_973320 [compost metagenome]